jgi:putative peptide zinc metalloprotease protein
VQQGEPAVAGLSAERVRVARQNLDEVTERINDLVVRAPHDGVVAGSDPDRQVGGFVKRGDEVCEVVDTGILRIAATMDQRQAAWLFSPDHKNFTVEIRLYSDVSAVLPGASVYAIQAGQRVLPSAALGFGGGGQVDIDPKDQSKRIAKRPQFTVRIDAQAPAELAALVSPGERVLVRFRLEDRPLLAQWIDRLEKQIQGRVHL